MVDLSGVRWADPAGLVMTAAFIDRQLELGRSVFCDLDDTDVNLGVNRADLVLRPFVYVGAALRRRIEAGPGDVVTAALAEAGRWHSFLRRRPSERWRLLQPVENTAIEATRQRRIQALIRELTAS